MAFPGMSKFYMPGNVQPMTIPLLVFGSTWMKFFYFTINTGSIQIKLLRVWHSYFFKNDTELFWGLSSTGMRGLGDIRGVNV